MSFICIDNKYNVSLSYNNIESLKFFISHFKQIINNKGTIDTHQFDNCISEVKIISISYDNTTLLFKNNKRYHLRKPNYNAYYTHKDNGCVVESIEKLNFSDTNYNIICNVSYYNKDNVINSVKKIVCYIGNKLYDINYYVSNGNKIRVSLENKSYEVLYFNKYYKRKLMKEIEYNSNIFDYKTFIDKQFLNI